MQVLEFVLKTRVKYVTIVIFGLFCLILYMTGNEDHSLEEQQLGLIQYKKNAYISQKTNQNRQIGPGAPHKGERDPADFQVQFISGKELAKEVDNEHKSFQVHRVKIVNNERSKVLVQCQDPFSTFDKAIPPGGSFEFKVTDLFSRRHYWCAARYGTSEFIFRAYGEGAPRDNNVISLHKSGAFINGKFMGIEDSPLPQGFKQQQQQPPKGVVISDDNNNGESEGDKDKNNPDNHQQQQHQNQHHQPLDKNILGI